MFREVFLDLVKLAILDLVYFVVDGLASGEGGTPLQIAGVLEVFEGLLLIDVLVAEG